MGRFDFCGPTYQAQSLNADAQLTVNLYPEQGGPSSKSAWQMYNTPGTAIFCVLPQANRTNGIWNAQGRIFAVAGDTLYEIMADGSSVARGAVGNDGNAVSLVNSQNQLLVCSAGVMYLFKLDTNTFVGQVGIGLGAVAQIEYADGFFFARIANSQTVYASDALDGTTWNLLSTTQVSLFPDNIQAFKVSQRELFMMGMTRSVAYADAGGSPFPYSPNLGSTSEVGIWAPLSLVRLDNTIFWLSQNERGNLVAVRLGGNGYNPVRISDHAIENTWQSYSATSDAQAFTYEDRGHAFWVINFPTQNATWCYDVATQMWHQRGWLNPTTGILERGLQLSHALGFGLHLVGDRNSGNVYQQSIVYGTDNGNHIQRIRRAPHISTEQTRIRHHQLQIDVETGQNPSEPFLLQNVTASQGEVELGNNQILNLGGTGVIYCVVQTNYSNKPPTVTPFYGPFNNFRNGGIGDWCGRLTFPGNGGTAIDPATIGYTVYFAAGPDLPAYVLSYTAKQIADAGYALNLVTPAPISGFSGNPFSLPVANLLLRWSDDGGHTWGNQRTLSAGAVGEYAFRCIAWQLGMSRDRVYEVSCTDPIPWHFIDAYLQADGFTPTDRLTRQLAKEA